MKISGNYTLPVAPDRAYQLLQDPDVLAQAMPGCDGLTKVGDSEYTMKMKMAIAAVSGQFAGKVRISDQNPPESFRLLVEGNGKIGFIKGEGDLHLTPGAGGTLINYDGDVQVGGTIAAVGQRLLDTTSKMMIKRFFDKLGEIAAAPPS